MGNLIRIIFILSLSVSNAIASGAADTERARIRNWVRSHAVPDLFTSTPGDNDNAAHLVDALTVTNLAEMEKKGLLGAELEVSPWSDSYWPTYGGQIANRYNDPGFQLSEVWKENYNYLSKHLGKGKMEHLSPAEKYDLLVGDASFTLAQKMMRAGAPYADADGVVETWFGLCHGWAPASFMLPRPSRAVKVKAANGQLLQFTPSDLKALATLLWSNGAGYTRFIGGRCNDKKPELDDQMRDTNPDCLDTNPGTWHLAVVNQIGLSKRSFVMDASAGYEVWNQPVFKYQYRYVNPITDEGALTLEGAKIKLSDYANDPSGRHRAQNAVNLVKVVMSVTYGTENNPSAELEDSTEFDSYRAVNYEYELELDAEDNIAGGEWLGGSHPDFLWVPVENAKASSQGDAWLDSIGDRSTWNGSGTLPQAWVKAAKISSAKQQPLARVVERLLALSNGAL